MGRAMAFLPAPWGPGEGSKGQIWYNFNNKINFEDFYTKLFWLFVFLQIEDMKYIEWDFCSDA